MGRTLSTVAALVVGAGFALMVLSTSGGEQGKERTNTDRDPQASQPPTQSDTNAVRPLVHAHAHNDYQHVRPLLDALSHGFGSVEADIFLVNGQLLVGHGRSELKPERTLQALYLDPLRRRVQDNAGGVYGKGSTFSLLIELKTDGAQTYAALRDVLARYADILTSVREGVVQKRAVTVILTGNRADQAVAAESLRYVGIDGCLRDLDSELPSHLLPWISDRWRNHFRWRGQGPMPEQERQKLRAFVEKAHAKGRLVRFWGAPNTVAVWQELRNAGVDLLNADDLAGLERFLRSEKPEKP